MSVVEMGEHVGRRNHPAFAARLRSLLEPGGRLLVQQMSRERVSPGVGAFIETYIARDMHMRAVGETIGMLARAGLEIRDVHRLREHYALRILAWLDHLDRRSADAVRLIGPATARVWRLYLAGGALSFRDGEWAWTRSWLCGRRPAVPPLRRRYGET